MWGKSLLYNLFISVFQVLGCTAQGIGPNAQNLRWSRLRVRQWQWGWRSHAARRKHHGWSTDKAREKFGWAELHTGSIQGMMEDVRALVEYAMPSELQLGMGLGPGPGKRRQFKARKTVSMFLYVNSNLSSFHPHYSPPQVPMLSCLFPLSRAACDMFFCFLLWPRDALRPSHRAASPLMGGMSPQAPIGANEGIAPCLWVTQGVEPAPLMKHEVVSRGGLKGLHQCWVPGSV